MYNNVLTELILTEQYYDEYLNLIKTYQNFNRSSVFCRYYNINKSFTTYKTELSATYDHYNSGISYDIFEYVPLFYASQVVNDSQDQSDLMGQMFLGNLNVVIYSIDEPMIEDLITFPYKPNTASEVFRITNIRTSINGRSSNRKLNWYELTLETAPISDLNRLKITNRWVYSLNLQKNMLYNDFDHMIKELIKLEAYFKELNNVFDQKTELFYYIDPLSKIKVAPLVENAVLFDSLTSISGYFREFNTAFIPFGIQKYGITGNININTRKQMLYEYSGSKLYDGGFDPKLQTIIVNTQDTAKLNILNYTGIINIYDIVRLLNAWIWRNQIPYKSQYVEFVDDKFAHAGYNKELKVAEYDDEITCIDDIAT